MKSLISKSITFFVMAITLLSFSTKPGGEGFEIYLDNKLMVQRYGNEINTVQSLQLNQNGGDNLFIKYHHCGKAGKSRMITIKDEQNKMLKEFRYTDAATPASVMKLEVKEITKLKKTSGNSLKLWYASSELPNGRLLTTLNF